MATTSRQKIDVMDFDPIRPYRDHEVPDVLARSVALRSLRRRLSIWFYRISWRSVFCPVADEIVLQFSVRNLRNVDDVQRLVSKYFEQLVDNLHRRPDGFRIGAFRSDPTVSLYLESSRYRHGLEFDQSAHTAGG